MSSSSSNPAFHLPDFQVEQCSSWQCQSCIPVLCRPATTQSFLQLGRGLHHRDLLALFFALVAARLVRACLAHWIESHAARPLHELPASCTGTAHGLCTVHMRKICVPEAPLSPPWSFTSLMFCSGSDPILSGIPAAPAGFG